MSTTELLNALDVLGAPALRSTAAGAYTHAMHVAFLAVTALMVLGAVVVAALTRSPVPPPATRPAGKPTTEPDRRDKQPLACAAID